MWPIAFIIYVCNLLQRLFVLFAHWILTPWLSVIMIVITTTIIVIIIIIIIIIIIYEWLWYLLAGWSASPTFVRLSPTLLTSRTLEMMMMMMMQMMLVVMMKMSMIRLTWLWDQEPTSTDSPLLEPAGEFLYQYYNQHQHKFMFISIINIIITIKTIIFNIIVFTSSRLFWASLRVGATAALALKSGLQLTNIESWLDLNWWTWNHEAIQANF